MGEWLLCHDTCIIDQEFCRKIICSVDDEIVIPDDIHDVFGCDEFTICINFYIRVDCLHRFFCRFYFRLTKICRCMDDLSLKIGKIYLICIRDPDGSHTCCCKVKGCRCSKSAGSDDQNLGIQKLFLTFYSNLLQYDMAGVPLKLLICKSHYLAPPPM